MAGMTDLKVISRARALVLEGKAEPAVRLAKSALARGVDPVQLLEEGFAPALREAGDLWDQGTYFLPELMRSAEAMKAVMDELKPAIRHSGAAAADKGTVVIGTVHGDIHDIGKTLVGAMLSASGFSVTDLGADVLVESFIKAARAESARLICASALLTTTMVVQKELIDRLEAAGVRNDYVVLVGGAPVSSQWADSIGADGYAPDAPGAVKLAESLLAEPGAA
jgi:corrinoid protein of di/trimethylamine methyltransferase